MYFQQFYLSCLSHASYMMGSEGVAAVVDPQRDVEIYLKEAREQGLRIEYIIETHMHRDFVSGHRELAEVTGAKIYLGAKAEAKFPHVAVRDGDELMLGKCRIQFLETPGHSLDSISVLVTDLEKSSEPFAVMTGDTLFIGDVGRPDLAPNQTPRQLAALLYRSLHDKLLRLPDHVEVYPAHGAGSLCGKQLSNERVSTIGHEKARNYALRAKSEDEFISMVTADLPERPAYFQADAEINREGATPLSQLPPVPALSAHEAQAKQKEGAVILDTRPAAEYAPAHIPRSIQIGLSGQYASWAGALLGLETPLILVAENEERVNEARVRLARVGLERVIGYLQDGISGWIREGLPVAQVNQISVQDLRKTLDELPEGIQVVDVRRPAEWQEGVIPGARLKPLDKLAESLSDLDRSEPVAAYCKSGYRSSIATSVLEGAGFEQVLNITGGFDAWRGTGLPTQPGKRVERA